MPRFFIESVESDFIEITGDDARHIALSLRMKKGENLVLCDGKGREASAVIREAFPEFADKTVCLENLTSGQLVKSLAGETAPNEYLDHENSTIIVSVGRLSHIKGYDMAIDAAAILKNRNIPFRWYVVGEGSERAALTKQIQERGLEGQFYLLGLKTNPYPYMKFADILVQSSRYEGKSVVLDEAKILGKRIVVTNYNSAKDQITHGVTGLIAEMSPEGIAEQIERYINYPEVPDGPVSSVYIDDSSAIDRYMAILVGSKI